MGRLLVLAMLWNLLLNGMETLCSGVKSNEALKETSCESPLGRHY